MTLQAGIIGFGIMGRAVANTLRRLRTVHLRSIADRGEQALEVARKEFGVERTHNEWADMLEKEQLDVLFIATPDWAHFDPVMAALDKGIHVYVEKPMTTSEAEARQIVQRIRQTRCKLQVSYNHRWLAPYHATKDKIAAGAIGNPISFYARKNNPITVPTKMLPSWARESSPLWFQSSHDIDLVNWWAGDDNPVRVYCQGVKRVLRDQLGWDTWDALHGQVRYASGAIATFESCWVLPEGHPASPDSFMEIIGEKGQIHVDRKAEAIEMSTPDGLAWPRSFLNYPIFGQWTGAFPSCVSSFVQAVEEDFQPHVSAMDGWKATAILEALHQSADLGQPVDLPTAP
jgi:predicted dehydrogenase